MLTQNQLNDLFTQKFGRNATPDEYSKFSNSDLTYLNSLTSDPTFANVGGTIYNKTTNTPFSTPDQFASALGVSDPSQINWSKLSLDTSYNPAQAQLNNPAPTFDYQTDYQKELDSTGATAAQTTIKNLNQQINDIDNELNSLYQSKLQDAAASGGIANDTQIRAEVAMEKQPLILQRSSLVNQLSAATSAYNTAQRQADTSTQFAEKSFTDSQTAQRNALDTASKIITAIGSGQLDPSTIDPSQLASIEQAAGLPTGILSKITASGQFAAHSFVTDNNGNTTFVGVTKNGKTVTTPLGNIGKSNAYGTAPGTLNSGSTLQDFFSSYAPAGDGANDPASYANDVAQQLGIDPSTPITQLAGQETAVAQAIATHEGFFSGSSQIAVKDNNPGALKFAGQPGATNDSGWAKFSTLTAGWTALENQIKSYIEKAYGLTSGDYDIAQKLANGQLGLTAFTQVLGRSSTATQIQQRKVSIINLASTLNPNFNEAAWEQGQKFGANATTQKTLAAIDAVSQTFGIVSGLVNQAVNTGIPALNKIIMPGTILVGDVSTSNFATAAKALADELSGVLGYGSATDMKLQLGIDLADPTQSPQQFLSNLQIVEQLVNNRKNGIQAQIWQGTANSANPATPDSSSNSNDPLGILP